VVVDGAWVFAAGVTDGALRLAAELRADEAADPTRYGLCAGAAV